MPESLLFYVLSGLAIVASALVVGQRNPMYSVMLLITSFGALAGLYVLLDAPFSAVTQIIIYAGAIMVLFLFVVMLLNAPREEPLPATVCWVSGFDVGLEFGRAIPPAVFENLMARLGAECPRLSDAERARWLAS